MAYYPKNKIIKKTTNGDEFLLPDNEYYVGDYYITYDKKYITSDSLYNIKNIYLKKEKKEKLYSKNTSLYNNINQSFLSNVSLENLIEPKQYNVILNEDDYKTGKITRYFAKERNRSKIKIIEINKETFDDLNEYHQIYNYPKWDVISLFWQISGPLNNEIYGGNIIRAGIIDTNKRIVELKNKNFIGIREYLTDLSKFSKK